MTFPAERDRPRDSTFNKAITDFAHAVSQAVVEELRPLLKSGNGPQPTGKLDRLLTAAEVAERLNVGRRFVYDHAEKWPFTKRLDEGTLRFSERGLDRWLEHRRP